MSDDFRLTANQPLGAAIALRKAAAEFVDGRLGIGADDPRVLADVRPREDAGRPPLHIVALEAGPQSDAHFGLRGNLFEGNSVLDADAAQIGTKGFPGAHSGGRIRKNLSSSAGLESASDPSAAPSDVPFFYSAITFLVGRFYSNSRRGGVCSAPTRPLTISAL